MIVGLIYVVKIFGEDGSFSECIGKCTQNDVVIDIRDGLEFRVLPRDEVKPYWVQIGEVVSYKNQEPIKIVDIRVESWGLRDVVLDVVYPSGSRGTISVSKDFRQNVNFR